MAKCKACSSCEESCIEKISTKCILWKGKEVEYETFEDLIEYIFDTAKEFNEHQIDIKSLSEQTNLTRDEIIQLLVDRIIKIEKNTPDNSLKDCNLDLSILGQDCAECSSLCAKLQLMVTEIAILKDRVQTLENQ